MSKSNTQRETKAFVLTMPLTCSATLYKPLPSSHRPSISPSSQQSFLMSSKDPSRPGSLGHPGQPLTHLQNESASPVCQTDSLTLIPPVPSPGDPSKLSCPEPRLSQLALPSEQQLALEKDLGPMVEPSTSSVALGRVPSTL